MPSNELIAVESAQSACITFPCFPATRAAAPDTGRLAWLWSAARNLSLTKAAQELSLTQSAVSRQVQGWRTSSACRCSCARRARSR